VRAFGIELTDEGVGICAASCLTGVNRGTVANLEPCASAWTAMKLHDRSWTAQVVAVGREVVTGDPDQEVSLSDVERQNHSPRMSSRRFARLTSGFVRSICPDFVPHRHRP
jgi:hypothetical protein